MPQHCLRIKAFQVKLYLGSVESGAPSQKSDIVAMRMLITLAIPQKPQRVNLFLLIV